MPLLVDFARSQQPDDFARRSQEPVDFPLRCQQPRCRCLDHSPTGHMLARATNKDSWIVGVRMAYARSTHHRGILLNVFVGQAEKIVVSAISSAKHVQDLRMTLNPSEIIIQIWSERVESSKNEIHEFRFSLFANKSKFHLAGILAILKRYYKRKRCSSCLRVFAAANQTF